MCSTVSEFVCLLTQASSDYLKKREKGNAKQIQNQHEVNIQIKDKLKQPRQQKIGVVIFAWETENLPSTPAQRSLRGARRTANAPRRGRGKRRLST